MCRSWRDAIAPSSIAGIAITKEKAGRGRPRLSVTSADVPALEICVDVATADVPMQEVECKGGGSGGGGVDDDSPGMVVVEVVDGVGTSLPHRTPGGGSGGVDDLPVTAAAAAAAINGGAALNARGVGSGGVDHDDTGNRKDNTVTTRAPTSTAGAAAAPPLRLCRCWRHSTAAAIAVLSVVIIIIN